MEGLGALAGLEEEGTAGGRLGERGLELASLAREHERGNDGQARSGTVSAGGRTVSVDQSGSAPPPPPAQTCTFDISPDRRNVNEDGGDEHFDVRTAGGCSWSASSSVGWISVASSGGSGRGRVDYRVQRNTTSQERTGRITVAGQTHEVVQRGAKR